MKLFSLLIAGLCFMLGMPSVAAPADQNASDAALHGAGATYPAPLYQQWFQEYERAKGVSIDYEALGSGGGINSLKQSSVDFAASDVALSPTDVQASPGPIIQMPMVGKAIVIYYNLPTLKRRLRMTGDVLADIFLGRIKRWNDPLIAAINPKLKLPNIGINPVYLDAGSGDTYYFTNYLCQVSPRWKSQVGFGKFVHWPVGSGWKGSAWGAAMENVGSISANVLRYDRWDVYPCCALKNQSGNYVVPSLATASAALTSTVPRLRQDVCALMLNAPGKNSYPIVGYTFLLIPQHSRTPVVKQDLMRLLQFMLKQGQKTGADLGYVPLPDEVVHLDKQLLLLNEERVPGR
jgi:phosphate transport system substrate-binding protein